MALTPEDLVRLVQDTISTSECDNPLTFEPPDWVFGPRGDRTHGGIHDAFREHGDGGAVRW